MLVDPKFPDAIDPVLAFILGNIGHGRTRTKLAVGVYEIGHFSFDHELGVQLELAQLYPDLVDPNNDEHYFGCYGVCDNWEQVLEKCPLIRDDPNRQFVMAVTRLRKVSEPSSGGWRWRKWGEYIGTQKPQREYLHDEPEIEQVFTYHVYQLN